ncbi:MAG: primosomal protein N' [Chlamydiae bacterium]|nr:primosomal protein N' [Chlamydiota bacterium]
MESTVQLSYASVVLDQSIGRFLDYAIPEHLQHRVQVGSRVLVPLGPHDRQAKGTVWDLKTHTDFPSIKTILDIAREPSVLTPDLFPLALWMSKYYATPLHLVLLTLLPKHIRAHKKEKTEALIIPLVSQRELQELAKKKQKKSPSQALILELLVKQEGAVSFSVLRQAGITSKAPLEVLCKKQIVSLGEVLKEKKDPLQAEYFLSEHKKLSFEQQNALKNVEQTLEKRSFHVHLLHGVTGSGKTEIYLQAMEKALAMDLGIIFLVPEIALASQTIERLRGRFAEEIAVLHHRLSEGEKQESWHRIDTRRARIVVGARSAIFCPVPKLGLILVDEEQEEAYKQTGQAPCYHARDVAIMRAKFASATVVLGSATPSLESYYNALQGKYTLSTLLARPDSASLPTVHIVDMKNESQKQKRTALFSSPLLTAIEKRLSLGEQTLLLLNRRGYHTCQICQQCTSPAKCLHCDACLTFHQARNCLLCHLCGYEVSPYRACPSCHSTDSLKFKGHGTELVEKSLYKLFPECRVLRMDMDTTTKKGSHEKIYKQFRSGKADILVGTQMIAKGLHFPSVTLVGILHADTALHIPDFRASESLFQLITQAAGRAGRSALPGEVFIQSFIPSQPVLLHAARQDYISFVQEELEVRKHFANPPFYHLIKISFQGKDEEQTRSKALEARGYLVQRLSSAFVFFPVIPSGHAKREDHFQFQFLIKAEKVLSASPALLALVQLYKQQNKVRLSIDVDPTSTFF